MVSKDKRFIANMKKFFNRAVNVCLFDMFLAEIQTDLKQNKYWGHMLWSGRSQIIRRDSFSQLIWPISIRMTPDDILNKENNWIRGE